MLKIQVFEKTKITRLSRNVNQQIAHPLSPMLVNTYKRYVNMSSDGKKFPWRAKSEKNDAFKSNHRNPSLDLEPPRMCKKLGAKFNYTQFVLLS